MAPMKQYAKKQAKAIKPPRLNAQEGICPRFEGPYATKPRKRLARFIIQPRRLHESCPNPNRQEVDAFYGLDRGVGHPIR